MKDNKKLTLSIVIPVFNEEDYLSDCLDSIATQNELPDEVIVVDNNSTDRSIEVAKSYSFVKIIGESKQHQSFAQKAGFDAANGDIIGRIDADSILPPDWVQALKKYFSDNADSVAVSGDADPYDIQFKSAAVAVFHLYHNFAGMLSGNRMLWGSNLALRRNAWHKIRNQVLLRDDIWEDYDISLLLAERGKIAYLPSLKVGVSFRAAHKSFLTQAAYQFRCIRTYYLRRGILTAATLSLVWYTMVLFYPLVWIDENILKPFSALRSRRRDVLESSPVID